MQPSTHVSDSGKGPIFSALATHLAYILAGAAVLDLLSAIQKLVINAPFTLSGFIVPTIYGGATAFLIGLWAEKLRRQNRRLMVSLAERQYLLRDLHHRIQNNLQVVASLIALEGDSVAGIEESRQRIDLMATLHRVLYDLGADYHVPLERFFPRYAAEVCRLQCDWAAAPGSEGDAMEVPLDTAVVLGMIFNEVVAELGSFCCECSGAVTGRPRFVLHKDSPTRYTVTLFVHGSIPEERLAALAQPESFRCQLIGTLGSQITAEVSSEPLKNGTGPGLQVQVVFNPLEQRDTGAFISPAPAQERV